MGRWLVAGNGRQALMATSSEQHDERQPVRHQRTGIMQEPMDRQALVARQVPVGRPASVSRWAFAGRSVASTGSHSSMADTSMTGSKLLAGRSSGHQQTDAWQASTINCNHVLIFEVNSEHPNRT